MERRGIADRMGDGVPEPRLWLRADSGPTWQSPGARSRKNHSKINRWDDRMCASNVFSVGAANASNLVDGCALRSAVEPVVGTYNSEINRPERADFAGLRTRQDNHQVRRGISSFPGVPFASSAMLCWGIVSTMCRPTCVRRRCETTSRSPHRPRRARRVREARAPGRRSFARSASAGE